MPVTTRSMTKSIRSSKLNSDTVIKMESSVNSGLFPLGVIKFNNSQENIFLARVKNLLFDCQIAKSKESKMRISLEIFSIINKNLEELLSNNIEKWFNFAVTVYNKTSEFHQHILTGFYDDISDRCFVNSFCQEFMKTRKFLTSYLKNVKQTKPHLINMCNIYVAEAFTNLEKIDKHLLSPIKKSETRRTPRNIPRVNYSGMDISDEDEGSIYICETKWNNRIPSYKWVKYPLSQANEIGDEEWNLSDN